MKVFVKRKNLFLSIIAVSLLGFVGTGCTTIENVGGGTAIGAALGAGIGALVGDPALGAAIGAGAGAVAGVAKDSMEKEQQSRKSQSQIDAKIRQIEIDAEIDRQVAILKERGFTSDKYKYRSMTTVGGVIVVDPIPKENSPETEIIR